MGCVHVCQGVEVEMIGVIVSPDLMVRDGQLRVDTTAHARIGKSRTGWHQALITFPDTTKQRASQLIRSNYRTLPSRA